MLMDSIQNTKETSELIILMHKAAIARDICALTVATLRGAIIYPKTTVFLHPALLDRLQRSSKVGRLVFVEYG
jgi:hypothetical protein